MENLHFISFCFPTKPYTLIDALNRASLAQGGTRYAIAGSDADYNGHHYNIEWNSYRQYYVCDYTWAGRNTIDRGDLRHVLLSGAQAYQSGGKGSSLGLKIKAEDLHIVEELIAANPELLSGLVIYVKEEDEARDAAWQDARFEKIGDALWTQKHFGVPAPQFLISSATVEEYDAKVKGFLDSRRSSCLAHAKAQSEAFEKATANC